MVDIPALVAANAHRWASMKLDPARVPAFAATAKRLCDPAAKAKYQAVTNQLVAKGYQAVPWWFIAIVSEREYGGPPHWDKQLGQGDNLHSVSQHDPAGRGPFLDHPGDDVNNNAWLRCALDALIDCAPHAALWHDWTSGGATTIWEEYNGLGYAARGVPSAYVWSGTDQYTSGKYVADHVYRQSAVDVQEGCAPILKAMMQQDTSIVLADVAGQIIVPPKPIVITPTLPTVPPGPTSGQLHPGGVQVVPPVGLVQELLDAFHRL
jgi:lysozyme family protein